MTSYALLLAGDVSAGTALREAIAGRRIIAADGGLRHAATLGVTPDLIELRNLLQTADLIVRSALHRRESRGLHFTLDWPETLEEAVDTVLVP